MPRSQPKYSLIADQLEQDIMVGDYGVGSLLPTEHELMRAYGVSRPTIRQAILALKSRGIVTSKQGSGSRVIAREQQEGLTETVQSIEALIALGQETRRTLLSHSFVTANETLAQFFECSEGRRFLEAKMLRSTCETSENPIAYVTLWIDSLLAPILHALGTEQICVAEIIREQFGYETRYVSQTIQADLFDKEPALALGVEQTAACLVITRKYATEVDEPPFLIAQSRCKAGSLQVTSRFHSQASN